MQQLWRLFKFKNKKSFSLIYFANLNIKKSRHKAATRLGEEVLIRSLTPYQIHIVVFSTLILINFNFLFLFHPKDVYF